MLQVKNIDVWVKPIAPFVEGSYSYAIAFLSHRVDGYAYIISVPLKDVGLNHTKGYRVEVSIYINMTVKLL